MLLVGSFPFNSFLAGFLSCVASFVLAVCLRLQVDTTNADFKVRAAWISRGGAARRAANVLRCDVRGGMAGPLAGARLRGLLHLQRAAAPGGDHLPGLARLARALVARSCNEARYYFLAALRESGDACARARARSLAWSRWVVC
eukprot:scaffold4956_cov233-Prasinococcus_capsulatus_cf.AAC.2